ncbi:MAG: M20 family metallopeptidase [Planctomycetales bacterium]|nr:M20 family metallopeptidase [Planctomycetales bacterium]
MTALDLLKDLIAIPSVNPMGRDLTGPEFFETRLSDYLAQLFRRLDVYHERIELAPGRANVIARFDSPGARSTVLLDAHQDTVPTDGMVIPPFDPVVKDGRIYGRGACDIKGGMAAMLAAFVRLVQERPAGAANVIMSCTCDEESTSIGIRDLVKMWSDPSRRGRLFPQPPDVAIIAEPTSLDVVVAHRGATRWKIRTTGRACHSSRPSDGVNAIYRMAKIVSCLEEYAEQLPRTTPAHPLCGPATLSVGVIQGGSSVNVVPDGCTIDIDRRVIPGEDGHVAMQQVETYLRQRINFDFEMLPPWIAGATLSDDENGPLADRLIQHIAPVAGTKKKIGVAYGTHASRTAAAGVPSVVFGPGSIDQAHTKDEWLPIDELEQASQIYFRFCANAPTAG